MTLGKTLIRRVVLLSALAVTTNLSAAQIPSPALLIVIRSEHALAIADPQTMKVVGTVPLVAGALPHELAVSADGKLAFVTHSSLVAGALIPSLTQTAENPQKTPSDFISVIDLVARKELRRIETGPNSNPHGIIFAGGKVYFTAEGYKQIGRYDPASEKIDWMQGTGQSRTHELVITEDLKKIFTANRGSESVSVLENAPFPVSSKPVFNEYHPKDNWNVTVIPVMYGPDGIGISPDDKEVWAVSTAADSGDGRVSIIDVAAKKVSQTLDTKSKDPTRIAFTPDGKRAVISGGASGNILVYDAVTRKEIKRIHIGPSLHAVVVAPDGLHAYVGAVGGKQVVVLDLKTLEVTGRIETGFSPEGIVWLETR
jgi:YVTN family beta-propeller protein